MPDSPSDVAFSSTELELAHKIALQWADVPASHLAAAFSAMEPQLKRTHAYRLRQAERTYELDLERLRQGARRHELELHRLTTDERSHELELEKLRERQERARMAHRQHLVGVAAGVVVSLTSIGGSIWFGIEGHYWPMGLLLGPVLLALTKMFVLRKSDSGDLGVVAAAVNKVTGQASAPAIVPGAGSEGPVV